MFVYQAKLLGGPSGATVGHEGRRHQGRRRRHGRPASAPARPSAAILFASFISGFLYLGYLWMLWDGRKQTWQDKVVSSIVIKA